MDIQRNTTGRAQRRKIVYGAVAGMTILLLLAVVWLLQRPPAIAADEIWTGEVQRGELVAEVSATGRLVAPDVRAVTNRSAGVVEQRHVLAGAEVEPDTVLVTMSSPELQDDLAQARWALAAAEAEAAREAVATANELLQLEATVANAESEYLGEKMELEALQELEVDQVVSALEVERSRLRVDSLKRRFEAEDSRLQRFAELRQARVEARDATLGEAEAKVAQLEEKVDALSVRAGVSGVVQEVSVEDGSRLTTGEAVARIVNPERLIARVRVPERRADEVRIGLPVRLELGRETVTGTVTRVDPTVRERRVEVDVSLPDDRPEGLRPDLTATGRIEVGRIKDTLFIPRPTWGDPDSSATAFVRIGDRAVRRNVRFGQASNTEIEVIEGLEVGDEIILTDMDRWQAHEKLRLD